MNMGKFLSIRSLVVNFAITLAVCMGLTSVPVPVLAQTPAAQTAVQPSTEIEEIIVTGSLIRRTEKESAEAITIIKADALKEQGITNVEQVINTLTSSNPSVNIASAVGTFSGGGTYANLRGLGNGRTLVLLDGERMANNAFNGNAVDLAGIPFSAIDQVQVLREGASALYGSDAISGVINFITKKNYQGAQIQVNFDRPQEAGGGSGEADFIFGHGDLASDGYNFLITGSYNKQQELQATQRAFSATGFNPALGVPNTNFPGNWPGIVQDSNGNLFQSGYPACAGNPQLTTFYGDCSYRYSAATDLLPESHEISGMVSFTKALPANNKVQFQYFYTQSELNAYSGPEFYDFEMNPASPYFPTASQLTCARGAANCGGKAPDLTDPILAIWSDPNNSRFGGNLNVAQRVLLTFSGSNAGWDYAADLNYSKNHNDNRWTGGIPDESVLAPTIDPITQTPVLSNLINPFGPQSAAGQTLINSSYVNGVYQIGEDTRWSLDAHASHPLGDAFDSGTPATVALGFSVNGERYANSTTPLNNLVIAATGLTDDSVEGSRNVQAVYVELDVPIRKNLDLDISDREDRYSDFGTTNNGKLSLRYQPTGFLTLRATASTGFRAPPLNNLFSPPFLTASSSGTMGQGNPDCPTSVGGTGSSYSLPFNALTCQSQGLELNGGNKNLQPETSQNFDFGVVISPFEDLGITLDYYRILLKNTISSVPSEAIYGNPTQFSSLIVPNSSGTLTTSVAEADQCTPYTQPTCGYILRDFQNTGRITTDGFDLSMQYLQHTPIGTFHEDLEGTATTQFLQQQYNGGPLINLVGALRISPQQPAYRWQHNLRVDWTSPNGVFRAGVSHRFYSSYIDEFPDGNGNQRTVGSYSLVDTYVSVKPVDKLTVLFGIKNLLDTSPPFTNAQQNNFAAGYNALVADPLLRNFYINLKYTFF
jgi:iron complex outermembrane recepter protein